MYCRRMVFLGVTLPQLSTGGIAAAVSPLDDFETHLADTLSAGDGLCDDAIAIDGVSMAVKVVPHLLPLEDRRSRFGIHRLFRSTRDHERETWKRDRPTDAEHAQG